MNQEKPNIISIGYGRHLFKEGNLERERMIACATCTSHYDMVIFTLRRDGFSTTAVDDNLTLHPTNSKNKILALFDAYWIGSSLIKEKRKVIVTTQDPFETALVGLLLKLKFKIRLVVQEHGDFFGLPYWRRESFANRARYIFGVFALKCADVVRVVSVRTKKQFEKRGLKNVVILPVAVDAQPFLKAQGDGQIKRLFGPDVFVFLSVARFVPQKNFPLLLRSFADAHKENPKIRLLLVGKGVEETRLRSLICNFSKETQTAIHISTWSDNVAGLMKDSSAYVLSSNYEGWGRVLIEAALSRLPIVTTAVGCADEVIVNGELGLVVPVGDAKALTQAILRISTDTALHARIKEKLSQLDDVPGSDISKYKEQWAAVFAAE